MSDFKVIKTKKQYHEYVTAHKNLWKNPTLENEDDRELLELLIEKWEENNIKREDTDPVELLKFLMDNNGIDANQLSKELGINKATTSKILNYKKGMSKYVIRKLSEMFKVSQEAFNREYKLVGAVKTKSSKPVKKEKKKVVKKAKNKKAGRKAAVR
jgi:HTH-type transcriptional regulator/antitoxin HigA